MNVFSVVFIVLLVQYCTGVHTANIITFVLFGLLATFWGIVKSEEM